ncbi:hypothetical protein GCM10009725_19010 [Aeromicrobium tamlense]
MQTATKLESVCDASENGGMRTPPRTGFVRCGATASRQAKSAPEAPPEALSGSRAIGVKRE